MVGATVVAFYVGAKNTDLCVCSAGTLPTQSSFQPCQNMFSETHVTFRFKCLSDKMTKTLVIIIFPPALPSCNVLYFEDITEQPFQINTYFTL